MKKDIHQIMEEQGIEALFISEIHNVRYLSGYKSDDAYLLLIRDKRYLITDPRYIEEASDNCKGYQIVNWRDYNGVGYTVADLLLSEKVESLYFEENNISFDLFSQLKKETKAKLFPVKGIIENLRSVKNLDEIVCLRKACEIGDRAFSRILKDIRVGVTERELSAKLAYYLRIEGSDARCYENITLSGARTSLLHGIPSDKPIEQGDLILMDFGAGYQGYLSDMSRTVVMGKATEKQREIYSIIKKSEEDMMASVKAGVDARNTYIASLKAMEDSVYKAYHYTGVGHGIGLAVHEKPFIGPKSKARFVANNIITLEPGIYIPKWGGVRIEDQVIVTDEGCEVLTKSPRDLIELN
ncbi:M24 family metallopeptidase [Alkaliphilus peptidifermentans]|uniref:Xaa-Pro aminopeptidase n=1 Tax=Alkaliphilus peptidifermentans DSM 18978 TaxID=1120976 RepID=A0A1G5E520_9FIRM|nr:Xaa-Pro peptidase family protein [Alkaliphilus peptidifermentans]SCY21820.1 Xaa-Pro aminopeptidase [Alkaliphilus peptidifermentans DSM 18978]